VLVGDHGEGLGEHGQFLHGPNVFDEDVRVPLAIAIPGHDGGIVLDTVGTIDLVPTLVDLLGGAAEAGDRGRSLVPLLVGGLHEPPRPYYFENSDATTVGVVIGRDKLIYERGLDIAYRFDLAQDPDEYDDLHDLNATHETLLRTLVQFKPEVTAEELGDESTATLLAERLAEVDPAAPGAAFPLLVRLVALDPQPALTARCASIFADAADVETRLLLTRYLLGPAPDPMLGLVVGWLADLEDTARELDVVSALAHQGQPSFAPDFIAARMNAHARYGDPSTWEPWLRLVRAWPKDADIFAEPLTRMLGRLRNAPGISDSLIELLLEDIAGISGEPGPKARLVSGATRYLMSPEPRVRAAAVRVLGVLGDAKVKKRVSEKLLDKREDIRVRREAALALSSLLGDGALKTLGKVAAEPAMTTLVVRLLRDHGTMDGVSLLERIQKETSNNDTRAEARLAIQAITARANETEASTSDD
jgi:HEAT repeats